MRASDTANIDPLPAQLWLMVHRPPGRTLVLEMLPAGMNENHTQTRHNRADGPEVPTVASPPHSHRFRFPPPSVGATYITGACDCGTLSTGLAYETNEYIHARKFNQSARLKK